MIKGYKIRIYPTEEQEKILWEHINGCRFIWNYMLALQEERFKNGKKHLSHFEMCGLLTNLKKQEEYLWLGNIGISSLQLECKDLDFAYKQFFKKISKKPTFKKKKKAKNSFPVSSEQRTFWIDDNRKMHIAKIGQMKYKTDFDLPLNHSEKFQNVRITFTGDGKWICSFGLEEEPEHP